MTIHNKLVRDKILEIITKNGDVADSRILHDDQEFLIELCAKLVEEAKEVQAEPSVDELADTIEVLYAIGERLGYSPQAIEEARVKKIEARGGFGERIYLISTTEGV
ncbi:MAG TPA: nucleoside triphosphate pyrophosphohydrolase [Candidatus Saccharimonadales bacterium]